LGAITQVYAYTCVLLSSIVVIVANRKNKIKVSKMMTMVLIVIRFIVATIIVAYILTH